MLDGIVLSILPMSLKTALSFRSVELALREQRKRVVEQTLAFPVSQIKEGTVKLSQLVPVSQERAPEHRVEFSVVPIKEEIVDVSVLQFQEETLEENAGIWNQCTSELTAGQIVHVAVLLVRERVAEQIVNFVPDKEEIAESFGLSLRSASRNKS